jgi:hypothetical protein
VVKTQSKKDSAPTWFQAAGFALLAAAIVFFMGLVAFQVPVPCDKRGLVVFILALTTGASATFLGGSASARGTIPFFRHNFVRVALTGGVATVFLGLLVGFQLYVVHCSDPVEPEKTVWLSTQVEISEFPRVVRLGPLSALPRERWDSLLEASFSVSAHSPTAFEDKAKLAEDAVLYALLWYLSRHEFDWQSRPTVFSTPQGKVPEDAVRVSQRSECSPIDEDAIQQKLHDSHNVFADAEKPLLRADYLCFPPGTGLSLESMRITIQNAIVRIVFAVQPNAFIKKPPPAPVEVPRNALTFVPASVYPFVVRSTITYMAGSSETLKYRRWANRVVEGLTNWFAS